MVILLLNYSKKDLNPEGKGGVLGFLRLD